MKETTTANIGGRVFNIEQQAFSLLNKYLEAINQAITDRQIATEVLEDVEARIAELFGQKLGLYQQVITSRHVEQVIDLLGHPSVFADTPVDNQSAFGQTNTDWQHIDQHDDEQKYFKNPDSKPLPKRIFRDTDNAVLGGVCAGIANYFSVNTLWIRLAIVISVIGFGFGFWIYLILWLAIPKAKTRAEKLEMHGQAINLENLEKNIREELDNIKKGFGKISSQTKLGKQSLSPFLGLIKRTFYFLFLIIKRLVVWASKFIAVFWIITGVIIITAIGIFVFGEANSGFASFSINQLYELILINSNQVILFKIGLVFVFILPVLYTLFVTTRWILALKSNQRYVGIVFLGIFISGIAIFVWLAINTASEFGHNASLSQTDTLQISKNKTIYIDLSKEFCYLDDCEQIGEQITRADTFLLADIDFDIKKSENGLITLETKRRSNGASRKQAWEYASQIDYRYIQKDSSLIFDHYGSIGEGKKWRIQQVRLTLYIPENTVVYLSKKSQPILHDIQNTSNTYDDNMIEHRWIMRPEGLVCLDCKETKKKRRVKFDDNNESEI